MEEEYQRYLEAMYGSGVPPEMSRELHQAFFVGAAIMFKALDEVTQEGSTFESMERIQKIHGEVAEFIRLSLARSLFETAKGMT